MKPLVIHTRRLKDRPPPSRPSGAPLRGDTRQNPLPSKGPVLAYSADGKVAPFAGAFAGASCFLLCGGPSLSTLDLNALDGRGLTCSLNNAWFKKRTHLWICADTPDRFWDQGWLDPTIMKFCPRSHIHRPLRAPDGEGVLRPITIKAGDTPNSWFYVRNNGFNPATFLDEPGVSWGTLKGTPDTLGIANSRSVMLSAMKILPWLGVRTIYLLGCDFYMALSSQASAYAWDEQKAARGRKGNNNLYQVLTTRLTALAPHLEGRGVRVYNCNPDSGLKVFPHLPYAEALDREGVRSGPSVTKGWY